MELERTGKKISAIRVCKQKVVLYFKGNKIDISKEAYTSTYLYVGKVLDNKEYLKLKKSFDESTYINYAINLVTKHYLSTAVLKDKLYKKGASKKEVDKTIKYLIDNKLLDDEQLKISYIESMSNALYGKNRIYQKLIDKKLNVDNFTDLIDKEKEIENCSKYYELISKKYDSYSLVKKREKIFQALLVRGYDNETTKSVINKLFVYTRDNDKVNIEKDYKKVINKAYRLYDNQYDINEYVINTLKRKGYKYSDIRNVMKENDYGTY